MKSKRLVAFTLIELLVVIAIVGILSGFVLVSLNSATDSAKDVKTKNDLAAISRAILTYHALNNAYPIEETSCSIGDGTCLNELVPNHIQSFPLDFNNTRYQYSSDGTSYTLTGNLTNERVLTYSSETGFSESDAEQGLPGYAKRQPITINSASALTDYQVKLTIAYDSDMQPDFDDLRFASSDGTTELSYWLESKTDSTTATIWVKIPSLASGDNTIYMYYANASATTASNGDNTFEFFDHFDTLPSTTKWDIVGTPAQGSSVVSIGGTTGSGYKRIQSKATFGTNTAIRVLGIVSDNISLSDAEGFGYDTGSLNTIAMFLCGYPTANTLNAYTYSASNYEGVNLGTSDSNKWFVWDIMRNSTTNVIFKKDGNIVATNSIHIPLLNSEVEIVSYRDDRWASADWILVRKYIFVEPVPSFGAEQSN